MLPTLIAALLLAPPPSTAPTGEAVYEGLPIAQRERFTANWRQAVEAAEAGIPELAERARVARLQIRFERDKRAALAAADKLDAEVEAARERVERLKRNRPPMLMELKVESGSIGTAPDTFVLQRLSDDEAICNVGTVLPGPSGQEIDLRTLTLVRRKGLFVGVADRQWIELDGLWHVSGTHNHTTPIGSKSTVPVIERYTAWPKPLPQQPADAQPPSLIEETPQRAPSEL